MISAGGVTMACCVEFDVAVIAGDLWALFRNALLLTALGLSGGLLMIRFPLKRWLGPLVRVRQFEDNSTTADRATTPTPCRSCPSVPPDVRRAAPDRRPPAARLASRERPWSRCAVLAGTAGPA